MEKSNVIKVDLNKLFNKVDHPGMRMQISHYLKLFGEDNHVAPIKAKDYKYMREVFGPVVEECVVDKVPSSNDSYDIFYVIDSNKFFKLINRKGLNPISILSVLGFNPYENVVIMTLDKFEISKSDYDKLKPLTNVDFSECVVDEGLVFESEELDDSEEVSLEEFCIEDTKDSNDNVAKIVGVDTYDPSRLVNSLKKRVKSLKSEVTNLEKEKRQLKTENERLLEENEKLKDLLTTIKCNVEFFDRIINKSN